MDDNMYKVHLVDYFLERGGIRCMDWTARSPDLDPIEHVWDSLGWAVAITIPLREPP